jgi:hypothetical protein
MFLAGLKDEGLASLQYATRHFEPRHLRSRAAFQMAMALKAEIRHRAAAVSPVANPWQPWHSNLNPNTM